MSNEHIQNIINKHIKRLQVLELQKADFGALHVPPHIVIEIKELQDAIDALNYQRTQIIYNISHLTVTRAPLAKGIIALVSPAFRKKIEELNTYRAIDYHRAMPLRRCWLIATEGANGSQETAEALAKRFGADGIECSVHTITNGADAAETQALVASLLATIRSDTTFAEGEVIADITAGTKAMTAGMVLACGTNWPMQCIFFQEGLPSLPVLQHIAPEHSL